MIKTALINNGCAKNLIDSELMLGILAQNGCKVTLDDSEADIVIVNTCSFIHDAEKESVKAIFDMVEAGKKVIITGCLAQKYQKELKDLIPEAVAFLGTSDIEKIAEVVKSVCSGASKYDVNPNPVYNYPENVERRQITMGASSYIKIADGCDFSCGYCIIPKLRGPYKSRKIENIVSEARTLARKGVAEIVLIAQDTTSYGKDIYKKPALKELLIELNKIEELSYIRIMYAYPTMLDDELLKTINSLDKVVKYIDIPLQHVSRNMLEAMNRPVIDNLKLIEKIRKLIPGVAIRTTFITGYPGETEQDFNEMCEFLKKAKLDRVGVFEYSREKGTKGYSLKPQISAKIKKQRKKTLMEIQQKISKSINESFIGKTLDCLIETVDNKGCATGRTYRDAPEVDGLVLIKNAFDVMPCDTVKVKITNASEYDLIAEIDD